MQLAYPHERAHGSNDASLRASRAGTYSVPFSGGGVLARWVGLLSTHYWMCRALGLRGVGKLGIRVSLC